MKIIKDCVIKDYVRKWYNARGDKERAEEAAWAARVAERRAAAAAEIRAERRERIATAALAAIINKHLPIISDVDDVAERAASVALGAVIYADALLAELEAKK